MRGSLSIRSFAQIALTCLAASGTNLAVQAAGDKTSEKELPLRVIVRDATDKSLVSATVFDTSDCSEPYDVGCRTIGQYTGKIEEASFACQQGKRVYIIPHGEQYIKRAKHEYCALEDGKKSPKITFVAVRRESIYATSTLAYKYFEIGRYGEAAILYSQVFALSGKEDADVAAIVSAALAMGLNADQALAFDSSQHKIAPSFAFGTKLKEFQSSKGLRADGILGPTTMQALANNQGLWDVLIGSTEHFDDFDSINKSAFIAARSGKNVTAAAQVNLSAKKKVCMISFQHGRAITQCP